MRIISVINQKGGVGKTTSTINLGAALSALDKRVLLIDLDPQAHLTIGLGIKFSNVEYHSYDLLKGKVKLEKAIYRHTGLDVVPSTMDLAGAEFEIRSFLRNRNYLLQKAINGTYEYDFMLLDCPPNLGLVTINAMAASNEVLIPLQAEYLALEGMRHLLETVKVINKKMNLDLKILGILGTLYDKRKVLHREIMERVEEYFEELVFKTRIRTSVALAEAPFRGKTIFEYSRDSHGAVDYMNAAKEIISRGYDEEINIK